MVLLFSLVSFSNRLPGVTKYDEHFSAPAALDYSKTFDTINHGILISKLSNHFDASVPLWFVSYLRESQQYVVHNGVASDRLPTSHGILQSSMIGLTLFLLYVNDLFIRFRESRMIVYADNITLIANGEMTKITRLAQNYDKQYKSQRPRARDPLNFYT